MIQIVFFALLVAAEPEHNFARSQRLIIVKVSHVAVTPACRTDQRNKLTLKSIHANVT